MPTGSTPSRGGAGSLVRTLATPGVLPLVASAAVGRLPLGMVPLGVILLSRDEGLSYSLAGLVVGAYTVGTAASPPLLGRIIDRTGGTLVLVSVGLAFPAALAALVVSIEHHEPTIVAPLSGAIAGMTLPPLGARMRALWSVLLPSPESLQRAYALEATLQELPFVAGPLLVAALTAISIPATPLLVAAGCGAAGAIVFAVSASRYRPTVSGATRRASALRSVGVRTVVAAQLAVGMAFGAIEVSMPAFAERHGTRALAGLLLGAFAVGSIGGGVWKGTREDATNPLRGYVIALVCLTGGFLPLLAAWSAPVMLAAILLAGIPIAPGFAAAYVLLDMLSEAGTATETFAWSTTSVIGGAALGTMVGGLAIQTLGYRWSIAIAVLFASLATLLVLRHRSQLSEPLFAAPSGAWRRSSQAAVSRCD